MIRVIIAGPSTEFGLFGNTINNYLNKLIGPDQRESGFDKCLYLDINFGVTAYTIKQGSVGPWRVAFLPFITTLNNFRTCMSYVGMSEQIRYLLIISPCYLIQRQ